MPEEVRAQLDGLRHDVRRGRRRSYLLGNGAIAAVLLGLLCWGIYYATTTLGYAELDESIEISRDRLDPDSVTLSYMPVTNGQIAFSRSDSGRRTELLDTVADYATGKRQKFRWRSQEIKAGDLIEVTYLDGWSLATRELKVPELPTRSTVMVATVDGPKEIVRPDRAALSGQIINAINGLPLPEATVRIAGASLATKTDADGAFRIVGAPTGTQSIVVTADGFTSEQFPEKLLAGEETVVRKILSPGLKEGQIRIVLDWGQEPRDLDAHLEGPLPADDRFHVYFHQKGDLRSKEFVRLDVDDRSGGGPETITVLGVLPGVYRYYVHDYTNSDDPASHALARSGAQVRVFHGGQTYRFHTEGDVPGNLWDVCTIEVTDDGAVVRKIDQYRGTKVAALGLYDKRTRADRPQWITRYGGSAISEKAVTDGLEWLARHQADEGFWSSECLAEGQWSQCEKGHICEGPGRKYEMAQSGLALLAFQAGGHYYFNRNQYSQRVRKGLDWLVANQRPDGALVSEKSRGGHSRYHTFYMYDHGIATFALADACAAAVASGQPVDQKYLQACQRAVQYIETQQHEDGGWRYTDDFERPGDASVSGWQVLALKSAKEAGIDVNYRCIEKTRDFFARLEMDGDGRTWYRRDAQETKQESDATTGIGMLVRQFLLDEPDAPMIQQAAEYLAAMAEKNTADRVVELRNTNEGARLEYRLKYNYYTWYNCMLAMFHAGGEPWQRWNRIVRDTVIGLQRHDGCERGSWDPDTQWADRGGRVYSTALAILTLEVYYRYSTGGEVDPDASDADSLLAPTPVEGVIVDPEPEEEKPPIEVELLPEEAS